MRYRLAALLVFAGLPTVTAQAAPAPEPYAILDIGPPQRGEPLEEHRKWEKGSLSHRYGVLDGAWRDPEVKKLRPISAVEDARPWLSKNLRIIDEDGGTRLRLTFRAGNRQEQVVILNALLRSYVRERGKYLRFHEAILDRYEKALPELIRLIESPLEWRQVECNRKALERLRAELPKQRTLVEACKQVAVIKWAK